MLYWGGTEYVRIEEVSTKDQLDMLYNSSVLTAEGLIANDESMDFLANWLEENGVEPLDDFSIYVVKGFLMNGVYGLTGENAYQSDLPIVCIPLDEIGNPAVITGPSLLVVFDGVCQS